MGFPRQEYWSGLPFPSPGDLLDPGIKLTSPALGGWLFTTEPPRRPIINYQFSSVQFSRSILSDSATPWITARQASLSITNPQNLLKLMSIESVMQYNHLMLCCPLLLLPSVFPSLRVFPSESVLHIRWPEYWSFNFSISPSNEYSGLISFWIDWFDLLAVQGTLKILNCLNNEKTS